MTSTQLNEVFKKIPQDFYFNEVQQLDSMKVYRTVSWNASQAVIWKKC